MIHSIVISAILAHLLSLFDIESKINFNGMPLSPFVDYYCKMNLFVKLYYGVSGLMHHLPNG